MFPSLQEGHVIAVNPTRRRLTVELASSEIVEARVLYHGPADAVRVSHLALPGRGTWGLVAFPFGDDRAGVWLGSTYPMFMDALTTDNDPFMEYNSHWSGAYELLNQAGEWCKSFPDGTFLQVSGSTAKPTLYRHTVDENQVQQSTVFPDNERVPNPPSPFNILISHSTGATVLIDVSGSIIATAAKGYVVQANANGASFTLTADGAITGNVASGEQILLSAGGAATSYTLVRTDLLMAYINGHVHSNGNDGDDTGTPVVAMTTAVQSALIDVSE